MVKENCKICKKLRRLYYSHKICDPCSENLSSRRRLEELERSFQAKSEYNKYIFDLYLKYIRRYLLKGMHLKQAKEFSGVLETRKLEPFSSWAEIWEESEKFKLTFGKIKNCGCPFIKTGRMLEEIGVLSFKQECRTYYPKQIKNLSLKNKTVIESFVLHLKTSNRSEQTRSMIIKVLIDLSNWIEDNNQSSLLLANENDIKKFLDLRRSATSINYIFSCLNIFYRWCVLEKKVFVNPCEKIKVSRPAARIIVCSEQQCKVLFKFIKNKNSNPEQAFLLALILIWALKSEDLRYAKIDNDKNKLKIILHRKKLYHSKHYNREQSIILPEHPEWFYDLQLRFYSHWLSEYNKLEKLVPHQYLMLPRRRSVQPLTRSSVLRRVNEATVNATGERIPPRVLRKTSGHLHSLPGDASILSALGWSKRRSFDYLWTPKSYYSPNSKNE